MRHQAAAGCHISSASQGLKKQNTHPSLAPAAAASVNTRFATAIHRNGSLKAAQNVMAQGMMTRDATIRIHGAAPVYSG